MVETKKDNKTIDQIYEINEKLKSAEKEIEKLRSERDTLLSCKQAAKLIIHDLLANCSNCGEKMLTLDWNKNVYIVACANPDCVSYRNPIKNIKKADLRLLGINSVAKNNVAYIWR